MRVYSSQFLAVILIACFHPMLPHKSAAVEAGAVAENQAPLHRCCTDYFNTADNESCVSHDVSVGSLGVAAAVVAVEIVVFVVAYTFTVETTSNQRRNIKATDTATSVSAAVDLEVVPSAVVLFCCCWNNSRNNTKSLKFYHNVVINSRQFERLIFGYRTCLNSG